MNKQINSIIRQLSEVHNGPIWAGQSYAKKLSQLKGNEMFIRPLPAVHSIAEIIAHIISWRKDTILKLKTGRGELKDTHPDNWRSNDELKTIGWEKTQEEDNKTLLELLELLRDKDDTFLDETYYDPEFGGNYPYSFVLEGMLHHDIYHLGQIGLVIKLLKE
ncbi:DinB family protein [uncultured Eudoraea sp.]|uniref:DinB family protein n=1 Tax=uncultured Eudoraea sp. TaxID=1035614 RepID=UPI0026211BD3|nr:DinB family protein [uncultured Eudoraea sp.]